MAKIHKERKLKRLIRKNKKTFNTVKYIMIVSFYGTGVYFLDKHPDVSLFVQISILLGMLKLINYIDDCSKG